MILFERDFEDQGMFIHTRSTNTSFLRMHALLKAMGIKNNMFFLALSQKELMNIDPHNLKDPSKELAARIALEIKINPWYYYRDVVRVPAAGTMPIPFRLNRANLALLWVFYNNIDIFLVIPRQTGKTMSTQSIVSHLQYFMCYNFNFAMLTKDNTLLQENVNRLKEIRNGLPSYLLDCNKLLDTERKEGLSYAKLKNQYQTFVAQSDLHGAEKLGRGMSTPAQHWDESAFFKNIHISYPAALNATLAAAEQAQAAGMPHTNIITTTAGDTDTDEGRFVKGLINQSMLFTEKLYDTDNRFELDKILKANSLNKMIYAVFSYLQLGKSHEWFKEKSTRSGGSQDSIDKDYLNIWKSGTHNSVVAAALLDKIRSSIKEPVHTTIESGYIFRWYEHPDRVLKSKLFDRTIIMGLDTSENVGRDFTSLVMIDASDMSVLCTARCNESDLVKLAMFIADFLIKNENVLFIPERKSTASVMIALICEKLRKAGINPFKRIYNTVFQFRDEAPFDKVVLDEFAEEGLAKKYIGFTTTGGGGSNSRDALYKTTLMKALEMNHSRINDQTLSDEISQLSIKNGRIDHVSGGHDDLLIAYLLACWFVYFGRHLYLYNIKKEHFLSQINSSGEKMDIDVQKAQDELLARIEDLKREINRAKYPAVKNSLCRELSNLESLLDDELLNVSPVRAEQVRTETSSVKFSPMHIRKYMSLLSN